MKTVKELRQEGYGVRINHIRAERLNKKTGQSQYDERGGMTLASLIDPDGRMATGVAECSDKDHYDKKDGVRRSLHRALAALKAMKILDERGIGTLDSLRGDGRAWPSEDYPGMYTNTGGSGGLADFENALNMITAVLNPSLSPPVKSGRDLPSAYRW